MRAQEYALTKRSYYADFFTVPIATTIAVIWLFSQHEVGKHIFASAIFFGVIAWTFIEYAVHRWVFHVYSVAHRAHHMDENGFIGASPITTAIIGALAFWVLTATLGPCIGVGVLLGLVIGYLSYIVVHDRIHHGTIREGTWMAVLDANHEYHHRRFKVNYGVTSPVWDFVFGTYQRPVRFR